MFGIKSVNDVGRDTSKSSFKCIQDNTNVIRTGDYNEWNIPCKTCISYDHYASRRPSVICHKLLLFHSRHEWYPFKITVQHGYAPRCGMSSSPCDLKWPETTLTHETVNDLYVWPRVKSDVSIYIQAGRLAMMFMLTQKLSILLKTCSMWQGFVTNMTQLHFVTRSPTLSQLCFYFTILNLDSKLCQIECFIEWCYFGIWLWLNRHTEYELRVLVTATEFQRI